MKYFNISSNTWEQVYSPGKLYKHHSQLYVTGRGNLTTVITPIPVPTVKEYTPSVVKISLIQGYSRDMGVLNREDKYWTISLRTFHRGKLYSLFYSPILANAYRYRYIKFHKNNFLEYLK